MFDNMQSYSTYCSVIYQSTVITLKALLQRPRHKPVKTDLRRFFAKDHLFVEKQFAVIRIKSHYLSPIKISAYTTEIISKYLYIEKI